MKWCDWGSDTKAAEVKVNWEATGAEISWGVRSLGLCTGHRGMSVMELASEDRRREMRKSI